MNAAGASFVVADFGAVEGLAFFHDPLAALLNGFEVLRCERLFNLEVVVEAVSDVGADAELGSRKQFLYGLCDNVRRGVAKNVEALFAADADGLDDIAGLQLAVKIAGSAVDPDGHCRRIGCKELCARHPFGVGNLFSGDGQRVRHGFSFYVVVSAFLLYPLAGVVVRPIQQSGTAGSYGNEPGSGDQPT